ncbi:MAG: alpha-L-fucosidase [Prolixibacteraceae bacterium]
MKRLIVGVFFISLLLNGLGQNADNRIKWWKEARFGMFIHWGVYSVEGRGEWIMYQEHIPYGEYRKLAENFNPREFNPAKWIAIAKEAGMKYIVLTTRHHDGYCLYDSQVSDFTSVKVGPGRDLVAEFANECHKAGMKMGFYYSLTDWHFPGVLPQGYPRSAEIMNPLVKQAHAQIRELLTNYGKVDILWFDGMATGDTAVWHSNKLIRMARQLQPSILINDRAGTNEDFVTPENVVTANNQPWESCYTMNRTWGYAPNDHNYKPVAELIRLLTSCASQGGNFLLNVSPDGEGNIPRRQIESLREIGKWMKLHGAAVYNAGLSPIVASNLGFQCRVGDKVYLLIQRWPGTVLPFAWCGSIVKSARILTTGQSLNIEQKEDRVWLKGLPLNPPDPYMNVVELTFEGAPMASDPAYR